MDNYLRGCVNHKIKSGRKITPKEKSKIYIKKIKEVAGFSVWIVNGSYIRKYISEDFVGFDHHYRFSFIPKDEFWIDKERMKDEEKYEIDHLLTESRLMKKGLCFEKAYEKAARIEKRERNKSKIMQELKNAKKHKQEILNKIHKKLLKKYSKKLNVWIVNGEIIRDIFFMDFYEGGHDYVYRFIPQNEIWIEQDLVPQERKFILLHEMHERNLMKKGKSYNDSHHSATEIEDKCRKNQKRLDAAIRKEVKKQN